MGYKPSLQPGEILLRLHPSSEIHTHRGHLLRAMKDLLPVLSADMEELTGSKVEMDVIAGVMPMADSGVVVEQSMLCDSAIVRTCSDGVATYKVVGTEGGEG